MPTASCIVDGWRARADKQWYKLNGTWTSCTADPTINCVASSPTKDDGSYSNNMYTTIIKITTPSESYIGNITSISINIYPYDYNTTSTYLYGSLRTVDDSTAYQYSVNDYRTYVAGGSAEAYVIPDTLPSAMTMKFEGTFNKGTSYYLWLYTKSTSDVFQLNANANAYTASCIYSKSYTISFSAGDGSGTVPASITGYEGEYIMIGSETPTPPPNSATTSTKFAITAYNGSTVFGTHEAQKNVYTKYTFKEWAGGGWIVASGGSMRITGDITLVAQYTSTEVTTYSNNTIANVKSTVGTPSKSYTNVNIPVLLDATTNGGTTVTSKVNAIQSGTYSFLGWNSNASATSALADSTAYKSATSLYAIYSLTTSIGSVTLPTSGVSKASENVSGYTITLNPGSGTVSPTSVTAGRIRSYKFLGWGKTANATSYITSYTPTASNQTIYAIFDSGTESDQPATLPTPVRDGYAFLGWSTTSGGTTYVNTIYMPTGNITLYANYKSSNAVEMYIYSSGAWKRAKGYLCANNILFNECVDAG